MLFFGFKFIDILTIVSFPIAIVSFAATVFGIYAANALNISNPFRSKYKNLYGDYKMFNFSRERTKVDGRIRLAEWSVSIQKRFFRSPYFVLTYSSGHAEWNREYTGDLLIRGDRMFLSLHEKRRPFPLRYSGDLDFCAIVFERPRQSITIMTGFMCGYRTPVVPYCGVCLLTDEKTTPEDADRILGENSDIWFDDYADLADDVVDRRN